jgi:pimeloyl-ACP methyl ester carboxylesterase
MAAVGSVIVACGDAESPSIPSPEVVDTAEAVARGVKIRAEYSTTPTPGDEERKTEIVLDARVFGAGETGVIFAHMRTADQTSWFPIATALSQTSYYTILTFDFRGYGESTGDKEFNRVDTDLLAALDYMREELGVEHIVLVGASMGATAALIVGADQDIGGVASLSPLATYQDVDALTAVSRIDAPKLFIAAEDDAPATRSLEELTALANAPTSEVIFPGSAHGTDLFAEPFGDEVERLIVNFLDANRR